MDLEARFSALLDACGPAIYRAVRSYAPPGADREDLTQEVSLAIWRALPGFRGECADRTFALRIAHLRGLSFAARRRLRAREGPGDDGAVEAAPDRAALPDARAEGREDVERLFAALRKLPIPSRQALALALEGLEHREIGDIIGTSTENVAVRLSRARAALRLALSEES